MTDTHQPTRPLVQWMPDTRKKPEAEHEPTNPGVFIAIVAVLLVGMAFIGAIDGMIR